MCALLLPQPHPLHRPFSVGMDSDEEAEAQVQADAAAAVAAAAAASSPGKAKPSQPKAAAPGPTSSASKQAKAAEQAGEASSSSSAAVTATTPAKVDARTTLSRFLPTSRRLVQFSNGRQPAEGARIVYIDGAFDCFHSGHVKILKVMMDDLI